MTTRDTAYASLVAVGPQQNWHKTGCVAWVDSRDEPCGKPRQEGLLCKRHHATAARRFRKRCAEMERLRQAGKLILQEHEAKWRGELARVEAELERRTTLPTQDRAAWGGAVHPTLQRIKMNQMSDSNVQRVGYLLRRRGELQRKLGLVGKGEY